MLTHGDLNNFYYDGEKIQNGGWGVAGGDCGSLHLRVFIDADESTLRAMRVQANVSKRGMSATDSHARVDKEMEDYRAFTLPLKSQADLVVEVNTEFEYSVPPGGGDASPETPDN